MPNENPLILPCGDTALTVEFGSVIDVALNDRVLALDASLAAEPLAAIRECVPTYRSLMVHYDPVISGFSQISQDLVARCRLLGETKVIGPLWRVPVVYGGAYGEDLEAVAKRHGLTPDEVVKRHTAGRYRVYMLGFTPGYSYLGGLDPTIATPRRDDPRLLTPSGTISIGGIQAGIQCMAAPSGWHLLGRTPVRTYHPAREPVFLLNPGDQVEFYSIPESDWAYHDAAAAAGELVAQRILP